MLSNLGKVIVTTWEAFYISNGLMPAVGELTMLNRLLIVPGVEHEMLKILVVLRTRGSMVLQESRIMSRGVTVQRMSLFT